MQAREVVPTHELADAVIEVADGKNFAEIVDALMAEGYEEGAIAAACFWLAKGGRIGVHEGVARIRQ